MSKSKCMINPKNMKQLEKEASENDLVIFLSQEECGHCHKMRPSVEEACNRSDGMLKYVECDLAEPHCSQIASALGIKGTPTTVAVPRGRKITQPAWVVSGSNVDDFNKKIDATLNILKNGGKKQKGRSHQPQPQHQPTRPVRTRTSRIDDLVMDKVMSINDPLLTERDIPKKIDFCLPGRDRKCSQMDFEQKAVDFVLSW